jgi:hypothetical protein
MKHIMNDTRCRFLLSCGMFAVCSYLLYLTNGVHGIGWLILSLILIWKE